MTIQDISFPDPLHNLEYDDELLRLADREDAGEFLRFWESPEVFIVLGRTSKSDEDVHLDACQRDGVPVLRRSSGGGTVVQGPGCLNYSLVLSKTHRHELSAINRSYKVILEQVLKALRMIGIDGEFRLISDLVLRENEKKFSGNAQRRGRDFILHHGTILYDFNPGIVARYLKMPVKMPEYRNNRLHEDFMTNVPARAEDIKQVVTQVFSGWTASL